MEKCGICYKKSNHVTKCGHHFCVGCIQKWANTQCLNCSSPHMYPGEITITCPMCRQEIIPPEHYQTRSETSMGEILNTLAIKFTIQQQTRGEQETKDVFEYIWNNRIVLRKFDEFIKTVKERIKQLKIDYKTEGITPPPVMNKLKNL